MYIIYIHGIGLWILPLRRRLWRISLIPFGLSNLPRTTHRVCKCTEKRVNVDTAENAHIKLFASHLGVCNDKHCPQCKQSQQMTKIACLRLKILLNVCKDSMNFEPTCVLLGRVITIKITSLRRLIIYPISRQASKLCNCVIGGRQKISVFL